MAEATLRKTRLGAAAGALQEPELRLGACVQSQQVPIAAIAGSFLSRFCRRSDRVRVGVSKVLVAAAVVVVVILAFARCC